MSFWISVCSSCDVKTEYGSLVVFKIILYHITDIVTRTYHDEANRNRTSLSEIMLRR